MLSSLVGLAKRDTTARRLILFAVLLPATVLLMIVALDAVSTVVSIPGTLYVVLLLLPFFILWFGFIRRPKRWL